MEVGSAETVSPATNVPVMPLRVIPVLEIAEMYPVAPDVFPFIFMPTANPLAAMPDTVRKFAAYL
jgi:hypothetical protein